MTTRQPIDVERLVTWALDEGAGRDVAETGWMHGSRSTPEATLLFRGQLGVPIDGGGPGGDASRAPDDALEVWAVIEGLPAWCRRSVLYYGRTGRRPDAGLELRPCLSPVYDHRDRVTVCDPRTEKGTRLGAWCPVIEDVTAEDVNRKRMEWSTWHEGLTRIAGYFAANPGRLSRFTVRGPSAPARPVEPWLYEAPDRLHHIPAEAYPGNVAKVAAHVRNLERVGGGDRTVIYT